MRLRSGILFTLLIAVSSAAYSADTFVKVRMASGHEVDALPGQVIVRYRSATVTDGRTKVAAMGARTRDSIPSLNIDLVSVPTGHTVESFIAQLSADPNVEFAEPNGIMKAFAFPTDPPNDPLFANQAPLAYNSAGSNLSAGSINIRPAWAITLGDPSVVVAVVDTGADLANSELAGNLVQGHQFKIDWLNDGSCTNTPVDQPELGVCNGCAGVGPDQCAGTTPRDDNNINENTGTVDPNPTYHGTRVSGIIAAQANNGTAIAGVAPNCKIMPLKVLNSWGFGNFFSIAEGITYAAENGASVINMSLGGTSSDPTGAVQAAIALALERNCVVVAAAGNSGSLTPVNFPASFPGVIAVGSIKDTNILSDFSATGKTLDVVAPGENVYGTVPSTVTVAGANSANGTSFSSPEVAGVAALIRSRFPSMSWLNVTRYIDFTATDLGPTGFDNNFGFGRLNAGAALQAAEADRKIGSNPAYPGESFPYPNPFRPGAGNLVQISLPASIITKASPNECEDVTVDIMNLAGENVRSFSGTCTWDGRGDSGSMVASGLYFYFAKTAKGHAKGKLTLIK